MPPIPYQSEVFIIESSQFHPFLIHLRVKEPRKVFDCRLEYFIEVVLLRHVGFECVVNISRDFDWTGPAADFCVNCEESSDLTCSHVEEADFMTSCADEQIWISDSGAECEVLF